MTEIHDWIVLAAIALLAIYQQFRIYRIRQESKQREELFQIVTENAADMIALVDVKGYRLYNSPAYKRILGYSAADLGETTAFEQIHPDDRFKVLEAAREARATGVGKKLEYRIRHKDGSWRVLESIAGTIRDDKGEVAKLVIVNRDVTERKRAEEQTEHGAYYDPLTGLPSRRLFLNRLENLFHRAQRHPQQQYAVLVVDLDGFKALNEKLGQAAGDRMIVEIGRRLEACIRGEDTISRLQNDLSTENAVLSRMGGNEFTLLVEGVGNSIDAMRVGQRIVSAIAESFQIEGAEARTSASVGIAISTNPSPHKRGEELLREADVAMQRAKALGGSRCEVFDEAMHTRAVNRLKLELELREALMNHQFRVYYQPVVQLETKQIVGFEVLLRWQHPEQGLISPYKFIDAAEDIGLLLSAGHWLIREACRQLLAWDCENPQRRPVTISVNLSARQFAETSFVAELQNILRDTGMEPSRLQMEITESVAAADPKITVSVLSSLKRLGVRVILDNFGAGNCSLSGLRQFPVDALKIDRSIVAEMMADRAACDMIELIPLLARKLKLQLIAEGIETAKQCEHLHELGYDMGQGYLFSQSVDSEAAGKFLLESNHGINAKAAGA
jgi:diguanylate cyclase (GGDEF)-like protein/PAS domain S-box-containing protein